MNSIEVIKAIKKIYPEIDGGFMYWESRRDGSPWNNLEDGLVWENRIYDKPSWQEIVDNIPSETEKKKSELAYKLVLSRKKFLENTSAEALIAIECGEDYKDLKDKRMLAHNEIKQIKSANTLSALNKFNIIFK